MIDLKKRWLGRSRLSASALVLGLFVAGVGASGDVVTASDGAGGWRAEQFALIKKIAQETGTARVIVHLDLPNIGALTRASTDAKAAEVAAQADAQLATAIGAAQQTELAKLGAVRHHVNRTFHTVPFVALSVSEAALEILEASPVVLGITEDRADKFALDSTVPIVGADQAWAQGFDGSGWYVVVLDSGIRDTHDFFQGKDIVQACFASGADGNPATGGDCPNGQAQDTTSPDAARPHPSRYLGYDHGTHVTGIAVGNDPAEPLFGVARGADIVAVQIGSRVDNDPGCPGYPAQPDCLDLWLSDQMAALEYAYALRTAYDIACVNMSFGGGKFSDQEECDNDNLAIKEIILNLHAAGIASIAASGNDGYCSAMRAPACILEAVSVGATDDGDHEASYSNFDPQMLELYAPGVGVQSSVATADDDYDVAGGTSMATPHVAGAWAVMKQRFPNAGVEGVLRALQDTGRPVSGRCRALPEQRRIQIDEALDAWGACCRALDGTCEDYTLKGDCLPDRWVPQTLCSDLDPPCVAHGPNAQMIVALDRTGSMQEVRRRTGRTRCKDAVLQAFDDVYRFCDGQDDRSVAIWTFTSRDDHTRIVRRHTEPFVDCSAPYLMTAIDALAHLYERRCKGNTPLAEAACQLAEEFDENLGSQEKILVISSDGKDTKSKGECKGPWSQAQQPPPPGNYDEGSWQKKVWDKLQDEVVVLVRHWQAFERSGRGDVDIETGAPLANGVSDEVFFADLAQSTGGNYVMLDDGDATSPEPAGACCTPDEVCGSWMPRSFCLDKGGRYVGDDTVCRDGRCPIPAVTEWGLVVMTLLLLTGLKIKFGRRRQVQP